MANGIMAWVQRLFGSANGDAGADGVIPVSGTVAASDATHEMATATSLPQTPEPQSANRAAYTSDLTATRHDLLQSLDAQQQYGWRSLQESGVVAALRQASDRRKWVWVESAQGLVDLASTISPDGAEMLFCLSHAMEIHSSQSPAPAPLPASARQVVLALCAVAMERWVSQVKLPPCEDGGIHLAVEDLHTVYHLTAAAFKLKNRLHPAIHRTPALILPNAPLELDNADLLAPTRLELAAALRGVAPASPLANTAQSTMPKAPSTQYIKGILYELEDKLGSAPVLGVRASDAGNALLGSPVQQQAFDLFGTPTAVFGEGAQCEATLHRFATDLQNMIFDLHRKLFPTPEKTQGDTMNQPEHPAAPTSAVPAPGGTYHFHAPVGVVGTAKDVAQANANQSQAVAGGNINNHGSNTQSFDALLEAFLSLAQPLAKSKPEQAFLQQNAELVRELAAIPEAQRTPENSSRMKTALENLDTAIDGVEQTTEVVGKLDTLKNAVLAGWPLVLQLFNSGNQP